jgi:phosphopantetheine--protein transferase-like protein
MNQNEQLRETVATMLKLTPDQIRPETSLSDLDTSLGGARLKIALKRLGVSLPNSFSLTTYGNLEEFLSGNPPRPALPSKPNAGACVTQPVSSASALNGLQVGIDVQDVAALPVAADYWGHEFYTGNFDKSEIAYAVVQSEPRVHFAGFWCAKEALRKCDPTYGQVSFDSIVVMHEQDGKPYLIRQTPSGAVRLPHSLSVSHTAQLATAIVASVPTAPAAKRAEKSISELEVSPSTGATVSRGTSGAGKLFLLTAGLVVLAAASYLLLRFLGRI